MLVCFRPLPSLRHTSRCLEGGVDLGGLWVTLSVWEWLIYACIPALVTTPAVVVVIIRGEVKSSSPSSWGWWRQGTLWSSPGLVPLTSTLAPWHMWQEVPFQPIVFNFEQVWSYHYLPLTCPASGSVEDEGGGHPPHHPRFRF